LSSSDNATESDPFSSGPSSFSSNEFNEVEEEAQEQLQKVWDDVNASSLNETQNAPAITFAYYSSCLVIVMHMVWKQVKRWADEAELVTSVHLHHAQVDAENKRAALGRVAKVEPGLFLLT
jgi:hypothetical protein